MGALSGLYIPPFCVPVRLNAASLKELILCNINSCFFCQQSVAFNLAVPFWTLQLLYMPGLNTPGSKYFSVDYCYYHRVLLWHFILRDGYITLFGSDS